MAYLTRDEILKADDIEERDVDVPQWGGSVKVRTLTQRQATNLRQQATRTDPVTRQGVIDNNLLEALLFVEGVVEPKFTMADYGNLQDKSMSAMMKVLRDIMALSGLSEESLSDATKSDAVRPEPAFRVLPSTPFGDDEGTTA